MEKMKPILKWVAIGLLGLLLVTTFFVTLLMGYIMFAPDTFPKPFYLAYQGSSSTTTSNSQQTSTTGQQHSLSQSSVTTGHNTTPLSVPFEIKPGQGILFDTGTKIVNLAEPSGRRYIRANIVLEFAPSDIAYYLESTQAETDKKSTKEGEEAAAAPTYEETFKAGLELKRPLIDDTIITLLSSKSFESIYTAAGKEELRKEIMTLLNARMPEYRIIYVYFTEFTVQ